MAGGPGHADDLHAEVDRGRVLPGRRRRAEQPGGAAAGDAIVLAEAAGGQHATTGLQDPGAQVAVVPAAGNLRRAFELDPGLRQKALDDADLAPVWPGLPWP